MSGVPRSIVVAAALLVVAPSVVAGDWVHEDLGAAGLLQSLRRLGTTATVLHVVAHPDDEDGALLTYFARGTGATTSLFSITRGEGGANLISSDFFDALGVLRTLEHAEAARHYGASVFYSHAVDYGYSKTLQEASRQWKNGEPILADLVRVIRRERPDVIVARFRGDPRDGHGHHQMAGVLARRAVDAAADPARFPEQIEREGLRPWSVRKLYAGAGRRRGAGEGSEPDPSIIEVDVGRFDPVLGRSYAQIARHGLGFQRSQGMSGFDSSPGPRIARYRLARGVDPGGGVGVGTAEAGERGRERSFFDGLRTSVSALATNAGVEEPPSWLATALEAIDASVGRAGETFDATRLEASAPALARGLAKSRETLARLSSSNVPAAAAAEIAFRLERKVRQFEEALALSLAVDLEVATDHRGDGLGFGVPGGTYVCEARVTQRSEETPSSLGFALDVPEGWTVRFKPEGASRSSAPLPTNQPRVFAFDLDVGPDERGTRPYWHRLSIREPFYTLHAATPVRDLGRPFPPPPAVGVAHLEYRGVEFTVRSPLRVRLRHPEFGRVRYPFTVVPRVGVGFASDSGVVRLGEQRYGVNVELRASGPAEGSVRLELPEGFRSEPESAPFRLVRAGQEAIRRFTVRIPERIAVGSFQLRAIAQSGDRAYRESYRVISARDLGRFCLYRPASHRLRIVDLDVAEGLSIGYVMGSGDDVPEALAYLGVTPRMLGEEDLATGALDDFDAVIIGVRAYAVRPDVRRHNERLLDYVKRGGVLIVQYQTPEFDHDYGPYPYKQGPRPEEVSEEDARVTILELKHLLFTTPNRIVEADFDGWVEQRGSKFWRTWDERYEALLECHDHGQEPQKGGMLFARYGEGAYIYSAYSWYRQLPEGVPGAFRIYANMISLRRTMRARR